MTKYERFCFNASYAAIQALLKRAELIRDAADGAGDDVGVTYNAGEAYAYAKVLEELKPLYKEEPKT